MRHFPFLLVVAGLMVIAPGGRSQAQVAPDRGDVLSVDVSSALRSGRAPGCDIKHFSKLVSGDRVRFELPALGDATGRVRQEVLEVERHTVRSGDRRSWSMRAPDGGFTHAQFVSIGNVVAGSISTVDGTTWRLLRHEDGSVQVDRLDDTNLMPFGNGPERMINPGALPEQGDRIQLQHPGLGESLWEASALAGVDGAADGCSSACDPRFVDLAIFYTPNARIGAGGLGALEALVELAVVQANTAFLNSNTGIQLRVLGFEEVDYDDALESGHLDNLLNPEDGLLDEVPQRVEALGADIGSLIIENGEGYCGVAQFFPGRYHINVRFCLGSFVLAHEVGHNLGACHAEGDSGGCDSDADFVAPEARGWRFEGSSGTTWRTVMAYSPGIRIPYFSTPDVSFDGFPVGQPADSLTPADNASVMTTLAPIVKLYECPPSEAQTVKVIPDEQNDFDQFGANVQLVNSQLLVGALSADESGDDTGAVFSFRRLTGDECAGNPIYGSGRDTCFTRNGLLPAADLREDDLMGFSLATTSTYLATGAPLRDLYSSEDDDDPVTEAGSVFLFESSFLDGELQWCFNSELVSSSPGADERFGESVAINGITVVVGAPRTDTVETFIRLGNDWTSSGTLVGEANTGFGESVAIFGNRLAVGAPLADGGAGAVFLYSRATTSAEWQLDAELSPGGSYLSVGAALSMDGDRLLVGCPDTFSGIGAALMYRYSEGSWALEAALDPFDTIAFQESSFGSSVALLDGRAVIGAPQATYLDLQNFGLVYLYQFEDPDNRWYMVDVIIAYDLQSNHLYGGSVDLSGDFVAIGATGDETTAIQSGATYVQYFAPRLGNDCNANGYNDTFELIQGISEDFNGDGLPDECGEYCVADVNGDAVVDGQDLTLLLADWGVVDPSGDGLTDLDQNGIVDAQDLTIMLARWGVCFG